MDHLTRGRRTSIRAAAATLLISFAAAACASSATSAPSAPAVGSPAASLLVASLPASSAPAASGDIGASAVPVASAPIASSPPVVPASPAASGAVQGATGTGDPATGVRIATPYTLVPATGPAASKLADITKAAKSFLGSTPLGVRQVRQGSAVKGVVLVAIAPTSVASGSATLALILTGLAGSGGAGMSSTTIRGTSVTTLQMPAPLAGDSGFAAFQRGQTVIVVGATNVAAAENIVSALIQVAG